MGRHKEWRKIAKKERRRRLRIQKAHQRDFHPYSSNEEYKQWKENQEALELFEIKQIEKTNLEENEKWLAAEKTASIAWQKLEKEREKLLLECLEKEAKMKMEWEAEQKRKKEEENKLREIQEKKEKAQKEFLEKLELFLAGDADVPPPEMMVPSETKPNMELCQFFSKTACCRFGDQCSRNHKYPGISKVLLAKNFYSNFALENAKPNEYDTDVTLEYEESDTYKEFQDFFHDVLPEFAKFGKIVQFKVCNNFEKHLRGNTFVEYMELRDAVAAYRSLHTRWYGGLQSTKRCPKGRSCNFLHVFRNPDNLFSNLNQHLSQNKYQRTPSRNWRWSESPEREPSRRRRERLSRSRSRSRTRSRSRSRSRDRKHRIRERKKKKKKR